MTAFGRSALHSADGRILPPPVRRLSKKQIAANRAAAEQLAREQMTRELKRDIRRQAQAKRRVPAKLTKPAPKMTNAYARATAMVYDDPRMSDSARRLVLKLVQWARGRPAVDAYVEQLADTLGVSVRTIRYAQLRAQRCGYLMVQRTRVGKINDANIYHLTDQAAPKRPYPRRGYLRSRGVFKLQKTAPYDEAPKGATPSISPPGEENASSPRMAKTSALKRGAHPPDTGEKKAINPLVGGEGAKIVPGKAPRRRRLLPETRPKP
jgi:hypothetical protein